MLRSLLASLAVLAAFTACGEPDAPPVRTVVLLTFDTQRRDRVGPYAPPGARTRTPRWDALAHEALVYDDARTPAPLTLPAHATMMSGLPPAATGVRVNASARIPPAGVRPYPLLAERLRDAGWRTAAFVSATPLARRYGLDQGFETYDDGDLEDAGALELARRPGAQTVDAALAHMRALAKDARLFLWVHLFDPHGPYTNYDDGVAAADAAAGRLVDGLAALGRGDAAMLWTADHGEALGEHGEASHGLLLGDGVLRVPFLLRAPGVGAGRRPGPVDVADVAPTLARVAGVTWPRPSAEGPGTGVDLRAGDPPRGRVRVAESLYAHDRFRWAQLAAAVAPDGRTLVELGGGRTRLLRPAAPGEPQETPPVVGDPRDDGPLVVAISDYKAMERRDLVAPGAAPGGYGTSGGAVPFLEPAANGALPDPYARMPAALVLDERKWLLASGALAPPRAAAMLREMASQDGGNPELAFWLGRAHERASQPVEAAAAYDRAWNLGKRDRTTLLLRVGVNALGHEALALERLVAGAGEVGWDCNLRLLQVRFLKALARPGEVEEACRAAEDLCRLPRERERWEKECGKPR